LGTLGGPWLALAFAWGAEAARVGAVAAQTWIKPQPGWPVKVRKNIKKQPSEHFFITMFILTLIIKKYAHNNT
jgi:hypothetical protein